MKKVLIVDDDQALLDVLEASLQYSNYNVKALSLCADIFTEISSYQPDVVILDYVLMGSNGGDLCYSIKSNQETSAIPVILITAYPKVLGATGTYLSNAILPKPFDLSELLATIEACISDPGVTLRRSIVQR